MSDQPKVGAPRGAPDVRFYLPAVPLRALVTSYYVVDAPGPLVDFSHPEWANIRFTLSGVWRIGPTAETMVEPDRATLFGPTDRTLRFSTDDGGVFLGVGLTPIGWLSLIGTDAGQAANTHQPLGTLLGVPGEAIHAQLTATDEPGWPTILDTVLTERARHSGPYYDIALRVQQVLMSAEVDQVGELADVLGVEPRTLHRVCRTVFGFSPVRLLRRQRFLRTLGKVRDALDQPLGQLIDSHYYDQAHFNRDFKAYMGMTPLAYFNAPREVLRRAVEERRRALGAPVQGLHISR
ncbi:MAG: helix-turn-helix domain-containing protein [Pseudomonadota bacterium]